MRNCEFCTFSEKHGYAKPGIAWHCGGDNGCHVTGYGKSELHCVQCHRTAGSETAFTAHQTDSGCRDPLNLTTKDGKRRFKAIERSGKLVWVRTDSYEGGEQSKPRVGHKDRKKRSVACERGYVHVSEKAS